MGLSHSPLLFGLVQFTKSIDELHKITNSDLVSLAVLDEADRKHRNPRYLRKVITAYVTPPTPHLLSENETCAPSSAFHYRPYFHSAPGELGVTIHSVYNLILYKAICKHRLMHSLRCYTPPLLPFLYEKL